MVRWGRLHKAAAVRGETGHRFPAGDGRTGLALREPNSETEFGRGVWSPRPSGVHVGTGLRPRPLSPGGDGGCRRIRRGRPMCRPEYVLLREPFTGGYTGPPLRGVEGIPNHPGQRRTAERLRRGCEGMGGDRSRDHPKGTINAGQSLSQPAADSSLYTREPLGTGDADCRVASLLAMTVLILCHSEEAQRADVGIRSFLRWTGVRAAVPRAWPPPTKFRSEIWGVGQVVGPYGSPRLPGQRLAKRKARKEQLVKFDFCPMTSECSTAHNARRFQQSSARAPVGTAITEQDRLAPHPAARQGAPRP